MLRGKKDIRLVLAILLLAIPLFYSCSSIQAGLYLAFIDDDNGETILQNEPNVRIFLENIINSYEKYSIRAFSRTAVGFQFKRNKLLTHSYYLITCFDEKYNTLSFSGTRFSFYSKGAWVIDSDSDIKSYRMYVENNNNWDLEEIFTEYNIDVRETLTNIINKMDSGITYYYKDHLDNKPNKDNCNTALYETIVLQKKE
jgi:hypothetical protein